jgi:hypothetical protein
MHLNTKEIEMTNTEIKRHLIQNLTLRNLEAYVQSSDKPQFIANLTGERVEYWATGWLDAQFYMWAVELELV